MRFLTFGEDVFKRYQNEAGEGEGSGGAGAGDSRCRRGIVRHVEPWLQHDCWC